MTRAIHSQQTPAKQSYHTPTTNSSSTTSTTSTTSTKSTAPTPSSSASSFEYASQSSLKHTSNHHESHKVGHQGAASSYRNNKDGGVLDAADDLAKKSGFNPKVSGAVSGRVSASDNQFEANAIGEWGQANVKGRAHFMEASGQAKGEAGIKGANLYAHGEVSGEVNLARIEGEAKVKINGVGELDVKGNVKVGANGRVYGSVQIGKDGVYAEVGGKAFAGVEASVSGTWKSENGATVSAAAALQVGIGIEGKAHVGFKDGKLDLKLDFGIALGVGFRISINISIDFKQLGKSIMDFFSKLFGGGGNKTLDLNEMLKKAADTNPDIFKELMKVMDGAVQNAGQFGKDTPQTNTAASLPDKKQVSQEKTPTTSSIQSQTLNPTEAA